MEDATYDKIFERRGISREVAEYADGFHPYEQGDVAEVLRADPQIEEREGWVMLAEARAGRSGGIMMRRWPVPEGEALLLSEMRPDRPIFTGRNPVSGSQHHRHAKMKRIDEVDHVRSAKTPGGTVRDGLTPAEYDALRNRYPWCATHRDEDGIYYAVHDGVRLDLGADHAGRGCAPYHIHVNVAKYIFAAQPTKTQEDPGTPHRHSDFWRSLDMGNGEEWTPDDEQARKNLRWHVLREHRSVKGKTSTYGKTRTKFHQADGTGFARVQGFMKNYEKLVTAREAGVYFADDEEVDPNTGETLRVTELTEEELDTVMVPTYVDRPEIAHQIDPATGMRHGFRAYFGVVTPPHDEEHVHEVDVKVDDEPLAARLSWHPYRREKRWCRRRVFFALEGCMKEAALVSAGEATFSVPSVWQWKKPPEFDAFAKNHLRDKDHVYVVCDSDGFVNDQVILATLLCVARLRRLGVRAVPCAPMDPKDSTCINPDHHEDNKHGADDLLGPCNTKGVQDGMLVFERVPRMGYTEWVAKHADEMMEGRQRRRRASVDERNALVLEWLAIHASPTDGETRVALTTIGRELRDKLRAPSDHAAYEQVRQAIEDLSTHPRSAPLIKIVEPLRERVGWHLNKQYKEWRGRIRVRDEFQAETQTWTVEEFERLTASKAVEVGPLGDGSGS
jgi:hypothetical protein